MKKSTQNRFIIEVYYICSMDEISKNGVISAWWKNENNCSFSRCSKTLLVWNLSSLLKTWEFENVWRMQMGRICWQRRAERALAQAQTAVQDSEIFWCTFFTITHIRPHFNLLVYTEDEKMYLLYVYYREEDWRVNKWRKNFKWSWEKRI